MTGAVLGIHCQVQCHYHPMVHLLRASVSQASYLAVGLTSSWRLPFLVQLEKGRQWLLPSEAGAGAEEMAEMYRLEHVPDWG